MNYAMLASLEAAIQKWLDSSNEDESFMYWGIDMLFSDNLAKRMAEASGAVLVAHNESQLFYVKENEE